MLAVLSTAALSTAALVAAAAAAETAAASTTFPFNDPSLPWSKRVDDLVSRLTLDEKVDQMSHGGAQHNSPTPPIDRLGIKPYQWGTECISGDVWAGPATSFPMSINMASSFDASLLWRTAHATGMEVRAKNNDAVRQGVHIFHTGLSCWSPVINIARHPLWGRNQETYGEDPYLNGALAQAYVAGLQGNASSRYLLANAGCKHFAGFAGPLNVNADHAISERDWQTTYLPQFKMCVDAGAWSFMCSYSSVNGVPSCGSRTLLTDTLRTEWGFQGYVVSDQTALEQIAGTSSSGEPGNRPEGYAPFNRSKPIAAALIAKAGCDLSDSNWNASDKNIFQSLGVAARQGLVTEGTLDTAVKRLFNVRFRLGEFDPPSMTKIYTGIPLSVVQSDPHKALALEAATKSMVLLKNTPPPKKRVAASSASSTASSSTSSASTSGVLPLSAGALKGKRVAVLGPFAEGLAETDGSGRCINKGALYFGDYGAGPFKRYWKIGEGPWPNQPTARNLTVTIADALKAKLLLLLGKDDADAVSSSASSSSPSVLPSLSVVAGCNSSCKTNTVCSSASYDKKAVVEAAASADVAIVCVGTSSLVEAEGIDRPDISLPGAQEQLLRDAAEAVAPRGGIVVVVLFNAGGLDVAWADRSDKVHALLAAGFPGQTTGTAVVDVLFGAAPPAGKLAVTWPKSLSQVPAIEDYAMGGSTYRYGQPDPLYPFGFGLSYAAFHYSVLRVVTPSPIKPCDNVTLTVSVTNTGGVDSDEVVLAFIEWAKAPQPTPQRSLAAFARVHLAAGATAIVTLTIEPARLAVLQVPGLGNATSTWMASAVSMRLYVGGQQPHMAVAAPSNVLEGAFDVAGAERPLSTC